MTRDVSRSWHVTVPKLATPVAFALSRSSHNHSTLRRAVPHCGSPGEVLRDVGFRLTGQHHQAGLVISPGSSRTIGRHLARCKLTPAILSHLAHPFWHSVRTEICLFICSFICSFVSSFVCSFVCSLVRLSNSFVPSLVCSFVCSFVPLLVHTVSLY